MLEEHPVVDLLAFLFTYFIHILLTQFPVAQPTVHTVAYGNVSEHFPQVGTQGALPLGKLKAASCGQTCQPEDKKK